MKGKYDEKESWEGLGIKKLIWKRKKERKISKSKRKRKKGNDTNE